MVTEKLNRISVIFLYRIHINSLVDELHKALTQGFFETCCSLPSNKRETHTEPTISQYTHTHTPSQTLPGEKREKKIRERLKKAIRTANRLVLANVLNTGLCSSINFPTCIKQL